MGDGSRGTRIRFCALAVGLLTLAAPAPSRVALASPAPLAIGPASAAGGAPPPVGYYQLVARHSGQCLDVAGASLNDQELVVQWPCRSGFSQQWALEPLPGGFYRFVARHSGKALEVLDGSLADFARVVQNAPRDVPEQQWTVDSLGGGYYSLTARHSGKALDVYDASLEPATLAIQYAVHPEAANQQFLLQPVVEGSQITSADATRFLEQATWGPTPELVTHVQSVGFEAFLDEQFNAPASSYPTMPLYPTTRDTVACPSGSACQRDNYTIYPIQTRFFSNALYGPDQLRQRVAFALHQIIVVSNVDITQPSWMAPYLQLLDRHALGSFRQLLYEMSLNPAMGNYLDITGNTKAIPNENYGREILQLFSLGTFRLNQDGTQQLDLNGAPIPAYTQDTVNNFARVFTGWNRAAAPATGVPNYIDPMVANQSQHDVGEKTLLNGTVLPAKQSAAQDLSDAIDNIVNDPNVGPFISKQLIQHLVTSNPSPAYVARVASVFNGDLGSSRGDLKAVVKAILLDPEARGDLKSDPNYGHLKHPALFITNLLRAFHARSADGTGLSDGYLNPQAVNMGMDLFRPPSVFSYYSPASGVPGAAGVRGPEFGLLSTSTALRRVNFVNTMVFSTIAVGANSPTGTSLDLSELQALAATPDALVQRLNMQLLHGTMSAGMRDTILRAVTAVAANNPLKRARTALYLVASSSQYQVEK
jgi:uncharacterized protein (DUF1800 family)